LKETISVLPVKKVANALGRCVINGWLNDRGETSFDCDLDGTVDRAYELLEERITKKSIKNVLTVGLKETLGIDAAAVKFTGGVAKRSDTDSVVRDTSGFVAIDWGYEHWKGSGSGNLASPGIDNFANIGLSGGALLDMGVITLMPVGRFSWAGEGMESSVPLVDLESRRFHGHNSLGNDAVDGTYSLSIGVGVLYFQRVGNDVEIYIGLTPQFHLYIHDVNSEKLCLGDGAYPTAGGGEVLAEGKDCSDTDALVRASFLLAGDLGVSIATGWNPIEKVMAALTVNGFVASGQLNGDDITDVLFQRYPDWELKLKAGIVF